MDSARCQGDAGLCTESAVFAVEMGGRAWKLCNSCMRELENIFPGIVYEGLPYAGTITVNSGRLGEDLKVEGLTRGQLDALKRILQPPEER